MLKEKHKIKEIINKKVRIIYVWVFNLCIKCFLINIPIILNYVLNRNLIV